MTLADRLNYLFTTVQPHGREYTYREVAAAIVDAGTPISPSYIWQLRTGGKDNPTLRHLEALAAFFHVPSTYFLDEPAAHEPVTVDLAVRAALSDAAVRDVALAARGLSADSLSTLAAVADRLRHLERRDGSG